MITQFEEFAEMEWNDINLFDWIGDNTTAFVA